MRNFMICLLAVGALAAVSTKETTSNKHVKRGSLTGDHSFDVYNGEQLAQHLVRYTQPEYHQHNAQAGPDGDFTYASGLAYRAESLPLERQFQIHPTNVYDKQLGQILFGQVGQSYDQTADFQDKQIEQGSYDYSGSLNTNSQSINNGPVLSKLHEGTNTRIGQVSSPRQVSVEISRSVEIPAPRTEPVSSTKTYQANPSLSVAVQQPRKVQHSLTVPVSVSNSVSNQISHREPLNIAPGYQVNFDDSPNVLIGDGVSYGQQSFEGQRLNFYHDAADNLGNLELHSDTGSLTTGSERVNVGSQEYAFGGQQNYGGSSELENAFSNAYNAVTYQRQAVPPAELINGLSDNQNFGYRYDKPDNKFTN